MNRRKFFTSFAAVGVIPVAAVAKAMQDDPIEALEDGSKVINGNVRINGSVFISPAPDATAGLSIDCSNNRANLYHRASKPK
jgi:hypothetical protein